MTTAAVSHSLTPHEHSFNSPSNGYQSARSPSSSASSDNSHSLSANSTNITISNNASAAAVQSDARSSASTLTYASSHTPPQKPMTPNPKHRSNIKFRSINLKNNKPSRSKSEYRGKKAQKSKQKSNKELRKWRKKLKQIGTTHPEFELAYDLLLGIRTSTSTVNSSIFRSSIIPQSSVNTRTPNNITVTKTQTLTMHTDYSSSDSDDDERQLEAEFADNKRFSFPSSGSSSTPPHHMSDFEFKDYCRPIFAQLREWFGVKPQTYLVKLCGGFNLLEFISNSKSGQFFFYSHDGQFLIKSMTHSECKLMRKILPDYYYYVKNQPNTLLTKFYGMYRVTTHHRQPIYFIVMGSVFFTDLDIHRIYDLKGSTRGRRATEKEKQAETPVYKDLDFLELKESVAIGKKKAQLFKDQLRKDTELLRKLKIMDYSLLIGIHYRSVGDRAGIQRMNSVDSNNSHNNNNSHTGSDAGAAVVDNNNDNLADFQLQTEVVTVAPLQTANNIVINIGNNNNSNHNNNNNTNDSNNHSISDNDNSIHDSNNNNSDNNNNNNNNSIDIGDSTHRPIHSLNKALTMNNIYMNRRLPELPQATTLKVPQELLQSLSSEANSNSVTGFSDDGEDEDEKRDVPRPLHTKSASMLAIPLKRVPSRRLSQIGMKQSFTVKTPLEKHFDMPELLSSKYQNTGIVYGADEVDNDHEFRNIFAEENGGMSFEDDEGNKGDEIYFCGIIDVLQKYNKRKKVENFFRGLNTDTSTISAVPPTQYSKRMYHFLKDRIV